MSFMDGLAEYLGQTLPELNYSPVAGGNVFIEYLGQSPADAIGLFSQSGQEADSKLPYDPLEFDIIARGEHGTAWGTETLEKIYDAIHGYRSATLPDGTYVVSILSTQASPHRIPDDENGRQVHSMEYRAEILNITTHRP